MKNPTATQDTVVLSCYKIFSLVNTNLVLRVLDKFYGCVVLHQQQYCVPSVPSGLKIFSLVNTNQSFIDLLLYFIRHWYQPAHKKIFSLVIMNLRLLDRHKKRAKTLGVKLCPLVSLWR